MLRVRNIEELETLLLGAPALVREQKQGSSSFPDSVLAWLARLEEVLVANRLHRASAIAALRSAAVAASMGAIPVGLQTRSHITRRQTRFLVASHVLQRACEVVDAVIAEQRPRLMEAERIALQVIAAARQRRLVEPKDMGMENADYLGALRRALVANVELEGGIIHLEGLVGPQDALMLLDRALALA